MDTPIFFCLLIDESNDRGVEAKYLVILLRFFDPTVMKSVTRFIDLPTTNNGTAAAIFEKVDECLTSRQLPYTSTSSVSIVIHANANVLSRRATH